MVGDINLPSISWSDNHSTPVNSGCADGEFLCELIGDNFLEQFVEGPTHLAGNKLDLLFCNCAETLSDVLTLSPDEHNFPTDHHIIEFCIRMKFKRAKPIRRIVYDYNRVNFSELRKALSQADFNSLLTDNIDNCWDQWKVLFSSIVTNYVPTKCIKDTNSPPWIDAEVYHLMRKKYTALRNYRKNKTAERKSRLRTLCQQIKYAIRNKHKSYLAKIEASFKQNPRLFWSYPSSLLGVKLDHMPQ